MQKWQSVGAESYSEKSKPLARPTPRLVGVENIGKYSDLSNGETAHSVTAIPNWNAARWGWLEAVSKDRDLQPIARLLASVLVTQFSNKETGRCDPSTATLARSVGTSPDTIKRAFKSLAAAGWLMRTEGRGRGNHSQVIFLSPGNVVPMTPKTTPKPALQAVPKGGKSAPLNKVKKGANLHGKGGKSALSYNKDKPNMNQRAQTPENRPFERPLPHLAHVAEYGTDAIAEWNTWLIKKRLPSLEQLDRKSSVAGKAGWDVPFRRPPTSDFETGIAVKVFTWMADRKGLLA